MKKIVLLNILLMIGLLAAAQEITSLTLINADSDTDIQTLNNNDTINLFVTGFNLNVRANTSGSVGSVKFGYNGNTNYQLENVAPYALAGDNSGDYNAWNPTIGNHTLSAVAYSETDATGTASDEYSVNFTIINNNEGGSNGDIIFPENPGTGDVSLSGEMKKWHKITLSFDGPAAKETDLNPNPFLDYRLEVTFTNGSKEYVVPGFFAADGNAAETSADSGNIWRVHFTPDEEGTWNWSASFVIGNQIAIADYTSPGQPVSPLDGNHGTFEITASDKASPDLRSKGRLEYVGEHYLRFAETKEYFLKGGPDAPENLLAYEDFDNTPNKGERLKSWQPHAADWNEGDPSWQQGKGTEIIGALNYLAEEGLNAFSFLTMNIGGDDKNVYPYVSSSDFTHFDCSKLDQWAILFDHAMRKGMYLHFKTQETENETLLDGGEVGTNRKLYYRELIARFGYHLALNWNLGEENSDQTNAQRKDMAGYFFRNDPYHHHIVIHTYPGAHDEIYTPLLGDASKLTGASIQTGWNNVHKSTKTWVQQSAETGKKWVVANDEQGSAKIGVPDDSYSGTPSLDDIRKQTLWGNLMAGGAGVEYYFGYDLPHSDLTAQDFRSRDISWDYIRYALDFFRNNSIPFWQMSASDDLVSTGWCLADEGNVYVVFLSEGVAADVTLPEGEYVLRWYDPRNGGDLHSGEVTQVSGPGNVSTGIPPSNASEDWVVLITSGTAIKKAPIAVASVDKLYAKTNEEITFNGGASSDEDGSITGYRWNFYGEVESEEELATHAFEVPGKYMVELIVTDEDGYTSSDIIYVTIVGEADTFSCADAPFVEKDNLVVVEVESIPAGNGWAEEAKVNGFTGTSYYRWNGSDNFNKPGNGLTEYKIQITNSGTYHFRWHSKIMHGTNSTESNDSWLRIPDADDFFAKNGSSIKYPKGGMFIQSDVVVEGSSSNGWMKVYSSGTTNWTWSARTSDSDAHEIYATFNEPGIYTVQISGRSKNHAVDRFVLFKDSEYSVSQATNKVLGETRCEEKELPKYTVNITVNDESNNPLTGAAVQLDENNAVSDAFGEVTFSDITKASRLALSVNLEGYEPYETTLNVLDDVNKTVQLLAVTTNLKKSSAEQVEIFPNPASGYLHLNGLENFTELHLFSASGNLVHNSKISSSSLQLNLHQLSNGMYIINLRDISGGTFSQRIVKQ